MPVDRCQPHSTLHIHLVSILSLYFIGFIYPEREKSDRKIRWSITYYLFVSDLLSPKCARPQLHIEHTRIQRNSHSTVTPYVIHERKHLTIFSLTQSCVCFVSNEKWIYYIFLHHLHRNRHWLHWATVRQRTQSSTVIKHGVLMYHVWIDISFMQRGKKKKEFRLATGDKCQNAK